MLELERALVAGLLDQPSRFNEIELEPDELHDGRLGILFRAGRALYANGGYSLPELVNKLRDNRELEKVGGLSFVGALIDDPPALWHAGFAKEIRIAYRRRRQQYICQQAGEKELNRTVLNKLTELEDEIDRIDADEAFNADEYVFRGDRLTELRERETPVSPFPELFDPCPSLHILSGKPKTGKTTFALTLAQRWALGARPWYDDTKAANLPGNRALVLSAEQPLLRVDTTLRRMDVMGCLSRDSWSERLSIVARDPMLSLHARPLFCLDFEGLTLLARILGTDDYGLVILDSLSRLKPASVEEHDNDGMSRWLDSLQVFAEVHRVYLLLIHHVGFSGRDEARTAARGASAIGAVAQGMWLLGDVPDQPRQRSLQVQGNALIARDFTLEVCPESSESPGEIHYWKPIEMLESYLPQEYLEGTESIPTRELAWRVSNEDRDKQSAPTGKAMKLAGALRNRWERMKLVEVTAGKRNAKMIQLTVIPHADSVADDDLPF